MNPPQRKPAAAPQPAAKKPEKAFPVAIVAGAGAVLLVVGIVAVILWVRSNQTVPALDEEKAALESLKTDYEPQNIETDEKGRVIKLKLEGVHVDDAALDLVGNFKWLREISLHKASVTDDGIAKLKALKRLQSLGITETRVTDKGLAELNKNAALRYVWVVQGKGLTPAGIEALKKALPGITVYVMNQPKKTEDKVKAK